MIIKKKKIIILTIVAVLAIITSGCGKKAAPTSATVDDTINVSTAQVKQGDIDAVAQVTGKIAARQEINILPKVPGKVAEVPVEVGSIVKKGQVVLKLDTAELNASVKQAEAGYAAARANYLKVKAGARPEQERQSKASLVQAEANYKKNLNDLSRMKELFNEGAISEQALEGQRVAFTAAESAYNSAKEALAMIEKGETAETLKVLEAQMDQARAVMELQQANRSNAVIVSPIDGIVGIRNVDPGEIASAGVPSLTIIDIDTVQVETNVTENQVNKLLVGQEVEVMVNAASPKPIIGKIKSIAPMANPQNKLYLVKIVIENNDHTLKPGMFAEISLPVEKKTNVLLIPREAITDINGDKVVYIVGSEAKAELKKVDIGVSNGIITEIIAGLKPGDMVITSGLQNIGSGSKVKIDTKK